MKKNHFSGELSTERLRLKKFKINDAKQFSNLLKDKEVASTTLMLPFPCTRQDAIDIIKKYLEEQKHQKTMRWAMTLKETNSIIGGIRLVPNVSFNSAELGFWIGKNYWKKGLTYEAATAVIRYGFDQLKINRFDAHAMTENISSINLLHKLGFQQEGFHPQLVMKWGEYKDVFTFGLLRSNFNASHNQYD